MWNRALMRMVCPCCAAEFPIEAGASDADGKRLAALFAGLDPVLGRAVIAYLRLFKPDKQALRAARALRIARDLVQMVDTGEVCRDERGGVRRPATPAMWAEGIEQMFAQQEKLVLPLNSHGYLRSIVFGLADSADAAAERQREASARVGAHLQPVSGNARPDSQTAMHSELAWLKCMHEYGQMSLEAYQDKISETRQRFEAPSA